MTEIFKTDDIKNTDPLKSQKVKAINEVKEWLSSNLNNARTDDDYWTRKGYHTSPYELEPQDLTYVLEEKKLFNSWFMKTYPEFNVAYNPAKRQEKKKTFRFENKDASKNKFSVGADQVWKTELGTNLLARERDLLFGTNNTAVVTVENWRERIRDATTKEEIEDIKALLKSRWRIDDFVRNCRGLIDLMVQNMQDLKRESGVVVYDSSWKKFNSWFFENSLGRLERKIQNQLHAWGTVEAKVAVFREAGMKYSHLIAYTALHSELERVYDQVKKQVEENHKEFKWDWKGYTLFGKQEKSQPAPTPPPTPSPSPTPQPNKNPEAPTYSDSDEKEDAPLSETEKNQKLEELKNKTADLAKEDNSKQKPSTRKEKEQKITEIEEEINKLEEKDESGISNKLLSELKEQIQGLQRQLAEIKKSLKEILENAKDYAQKLFNWFQKEDVKQITFEEDGTAKVEYENAQPKTFSSQEVDNHQELKELKGQVQQSEQKSLSRHELSQIIGSASSPTSTEKGHWEKYRYLYFTGIGIGLLVIGGLAVYWLMKKGQKEVVE